MRRQRYVRVRLSEDEARMLVVKATAARLSKSALLRDHLGRLRVPPERRELLVSLRRIGTLLNQIARWGNIHKTEAEALEVLAELQAVRRGILRLVEKSAGPGEAL
jgi:hypothetical protein